MAFAYLGNLSFITLTGNILPPGPVVEAVQRPGVNGTMWRNLGSKGQPFKVKTTAFYSNSSNAQMAIIGYRQSVGFACVMIDATGAQWDVYTEEVLPNQPRWMVNSTYGNGFLVECEWTLRMVGG